MKTQTIISAAIIASLAAAAAAQTSTTPATTPSQKDKTSQPVLAKPAGGAYQATQNTSKDPSVIANQPGREQLDLARFTVGEWTTAVTIWNQPNAQPVTTTGKAKFFSTMGGRFIATDFDCQFNGTPMKGTGFFGYNNGEKRYESTWIDNQTSAIFFYTGVRQDKTITWNTTFTDPTNGTKKSVRSVQVFGDNTINYTMFETATGGAEFKKLNVIYTRTGPGGPMESAPVDTHTDGKPVNTINNTPNTNNTPSIQSKPRTPGTTPNTTNTPKHN